MSLYFIEVDCFWLVLKLETRTDNADHAHNVCATWIEIVRYENFKFSWTLSWRDDKALVRLAWPRLLSSPFSIYSCCVEWRGKQISFLFGSGFDGHRDIIDMNPFRRVQVDQRCACVTLFWLYQVHSWCSIAEKLCLIEFHSSTAQWLNHCINTI